MVERRKTKAMAAKVRGGISLSNEEKKNNKSDIGDEMDLD